MRDRNSTRAGLLNLYDRLTREYTAARKRSGELRAAARGYSDTLMEIARQIPAGLFTEGAEIWLDASRARRIALEIAVAERREAELAGELRRAEADLAFHGTTE